MLNSAGNFIFICQEYYLCTHIHYIQIVYYRELWAGSTRSVAPLKLRYCVSKYAQHLSGGGQQDAQVGLKMIALEINIYIFMFRNY